MGGDVLVWFVRLCGVHCATLWCGQCCMQCVVICILDYPAVDSERGYAFFRSVKREHRLAV